MSTIKLNENILADHIVRVIGKEETGTVKSLGELGEYMKRKYGKSYGVTVSDGKISFYAPVKNNPYRIKGMGIGSIQLQFLDSSFVGKDEIKYAIWFSMSVLKYEESIYRSSYDHITDRQSRCMKKICGFFQDEPLYRRIPDFNPLTDLYFIASADRGSDLTAEILRAFINLTEKILDENFLMPEIEIGKKE